MHIIEICHMLFVNELIYKIKYVLTVVIMTMIDILFDYMILPVYVLILNKIGKKYRLLYYLFHF